ncbi:DUF742 domain-containing protein [Actinacidiphila sp. DG2A-62]|uniref:DUF742 domain-containing protein n=1 Tax=Actinacidiphila sp. DG2A-62 TaxID=3108821 RepID=UPI002DB6F95E|nr:DUF742 domain-containing protein [Actinacidiphila sp. DG2A-62]MEC3993066.1 DUF742 domain-containing protein [Actinacidiphila sp. DG2A-62]
MTGGRRAGGSLVPAYLATGGAARTRRDGRDGLRRPSVLSLADEPRADGGAADDDLPPAHLALLDALQGGALSVEEAADHLDLPVSAVRVLACDLLDRGLVRARQPVPAAEPADPGLLRRVVDGLRAQRP